jgi:hypothetical protein
VNNNVLLELVKKWEEQSITPEIEDGHPDAAHENAINKGIRLKAGKCAEELNLLIKILG